MKKVAMTLFLAMVAVSGAWAGEEAAKVDAKSAFETLKGLAGEWQFDMSGKPAKVMFEVVSGGSVVMERQLYGTDQEMMTLYHLADGELVATHYCHMGNQPQMKLDLAKSKPGELVFAFAGGTSFDPAKDSFIHDGRIVIKDAGHVDSEWTFYTGGKAQGAAKFDLSRPAAKAGR